jgi:hypothetical protein
MIKLKDGSMIPAPLISAPGIATTGMNMESSINNRRNYL